MLYLPEGCPRDVERGRGWDFARAQEGKVVHNRHVVHLNPHRSSGYCQGAVWNLPEQPGGADGAVEVMDLQPRTGVVRGLFR